MENDDIILSLEVLIAVILLVLYVIAAPIFEKINFHYMHESGMVMLLGILITGLIKIFSPSVDFTQSLAFSDKLFFTFILPLIIFGAGYNLKRRQFFKYFMYIFLLGVVGTLIAFGWVAPVSYFFNKFKIFYLSTSKYSYETLIKIGGIPVDPITHIPLNQTTINDIIQNYTIFNSTTNQTTIIYPDLKKTPILLDFSVWDLLFFASVISATDAVAALTFIHEDTEPKLFSILFGEGVVNDAVCIVIYEILKLFSETGKPFSFSVVCGMFGTFCKLFGLSFLIGLSLGCLGSLCLKKLKKYNIGRESECALICLFAYLSYILTEELELSPIIALLFNGIFNSHYSFYNLSFQAREESSTLSRVLSCIAEAFVFVYLGLTAIHYFSVAFSWSFMFFELVTVVLGRFCSVYGICFLMYILGVSNFKLSFIEKGISSCSGTIRGAIAFGLSISIVSDKQLNKDILLSTTLSLVFISTIVFGALMPYFIKFWKSFGTQVESEKLEYINLDSSIENESVRYSYLHPNFDNEIIQFSKEKDFEILKKRLSYWIGTYWLQFDDAWVKPKLICNWPEVKKEHDEIAEVIKGVITKYLEEKKRKKSQMLVSDNKENNNEINNEYQTEYMKLEDGNSNQLKKISRDEIMNKH